MVIVESIEFASFNYKLYHIGIANAKLYIPRLLISANNTYLKSAFKFR